jgi:hypothetical protein
MAQVLEPPPNGSPSGASWQLRALPGTNVLHAHSGEGCVLSEIRFAVFGGTDVSGSIGTSCKVLCLDTDITRWDALPPLHERWSWFKCAAIGVCIIVASGAVSNSAEEVYEEGLGRWRRLLWITPHDSKLLSMGSVLM